MIRRRAPAKLNLYLRVLGRRPDGYHEIETLFERIDLADELTFEAHPGEIILTCTDPSLACGEDNLVIQAARALQRLCGTTRGARIHLTKRIPIAAGLGGGSSDAAATLVGLNVLWGLHLERSPLGALAASLGSDVPFFLAEAPFAVGRGRGERCEPVAEAPRLAHVLVVPEERLSTRDVYAGARFDLTAPKPPLTMVLHALRNGSLGELAKGLWNDLEPEAIRRCPVSGIIQSHMRDLGCLGVRVSGSGASVFGLCADRGQAQEIAAQMRRCAPRPWRIEIIHTDHPVRAVMPAAS
ncbi:MAG: 4-(cytidine 5'-diphospho)-2-C-methyl-D-erythritol kinase [Candidatus Omnitrophica bacterium]|nr:4-(cytidine 5'-diphospho)-2-C-methyl-D-erythritol kinase [Candidatus Omnitrophota bacterium]